MGELRHMLRAAVGLASVLFALVPASAVAETLTVAPGAGGEARPCTAGSPCDYAWALEHAKSGDVVQFESGLYELDGSVHKSGLNVPSEVTLEPVPGDATRPVIRQTVAFPSCSCASLSVFAGAHIKGMQVEQAAVGASNPGAIGMSPLAGIERSILVGAGDGLYTFEGEAGETTGPGIIDTLIVADKGTAIQDNNVEHLTLDNDTLIGHLGGGSIGIALALGGSNVATRVQATNTIFRGTTADIEAEVSGAEMLATLHYSDARPSLELAKGEHSTIQDTDHPQHGEPTFFSETDFEETLASPTIGAGTTDPHSGALDLAGLPRSFAGATDIGAYQIQQATPVPVTGQASSVARESVLLSGTVDPRGAATSWHFEYGTSTAYGQSTAPQALAPGNGARPVSVQLNGLAPGTAYHFRLVASNSSGAAAGADQTFATHSLAPVLTALRLSPGRFRAARHGASVLAALTRGTLVSYIDSQAGTTTLTVMAQLPGVRSGKACIRPPRRRAHGRHRTACKRLLERGTFTHTDAAGANRLRFTGRLGAHPLAPGSYRLQLIARSPSGLASSAVSAPFTVLR
jgi:hypothetical protein